MRNRPGFGEFTYNNGDVEHHLGDIAWLFSPQGVNQLAKSTTQGIRQTRQRSSSNSAAVGEPQIRVSSRRCQNKRLSEANEDFTSHNGAVVAARRAG